MQSFAVDYQTAPLHIVNNILPYKEKKENKKEEKKEAKKEVKKEVKKEAKEENKKQSEILTAQKTVLTQENAALEQQITDLKARIVAEEKNAHTAEETKEYLYTMINNEFDAVPEYTFRSVDTIVRPADTDLSATHADIGVTHKHYPILSYSVIKIDTAAKKIVDKYTEQGRTLYELFDNLI